MDICRDKWRWKNSAAPDFFGEHEMRLIDIHASALALGKTEKTIRRWIWEKTLPAVKKGKKLYVRAKDIEERGGKIDESMLYRGKHRAANKEKIEAQAFKTDIVKSAGLEMGEFRAKIEHAALEMSKNLMERLKDEGYFVDDLDAWTLKQYCYYTQAAAYARNEAEKQGFLTFNASGVEITHPLASLAAQYDALALKYSDRLGLNPLSRVKLKNVEAAVPQDEMKGLFSIE